MADFRSAPSPTPEGKGRARQAWDAYAAKVTPMLEPALRPVARPLARAMTMEMMGFWMAWHLHGGFEGLIELGYHPATVWRKVKRFRTALGVHPDEYRIPGVTLDPEAYWEAARNGAIGSAD